MELYLTVGGLAVLVVCLLLLRPPRRPGQKKIVELVWHDHRQTGMDDREKFL